jgi:hypothetical protein
MIKNTPSNGRVVTVQTKYIGEAHGYALPETFYVALDNDNDALAAVRLSEEFAPNDDRILEVSNIYLKPSSISALGMQSGHVRRA